ncbi:MAG: hypothetical protein JNM14_07605 [Ferruginibacter sp.]|nr:hypothetical protein [Ferruginibacter sp.]
MNDQSTSNTETPVQLFFSKLGRDLSMREHFYEAFKELTPKDWQGFVNLGKTAGYNFTIEELKAVLGDEFYTGRRAAWKEGVFSLDYGESLHVEWINKTGRAIYVNWISYDGTEVFDEERKQKQLIPPDGTYIDDTYIGHVFRVRNADTNEELGLITVDASKSEYDISKFL